MFDHDQPFSNINRLGLLLPGQQWFNIMMLTIVNHGPTWNCGKDCLNMKNNDGQ